MLSKITDPIIQATSKFLRATGQGMDKIGKAIELHGYTERLNPSLRAAKFKNKAPIMNGNFVSSTSTVMGNVTIGANSSVWYGAIVRGDLNSVTIGDGVTVGEDSIVRSTNPTKNNPINIGNNVLIGRQVMIDSGVSIGDGCNIGDKVILHEGSTMEHKSMVTTGSILESGSVVKSGEIWSGSPAKKLRAMLPAEIEATNRKVAESILLARDHAAEIAKTWQQIEQDEYDHEQEIERSEYYYKRLTAEQLSYKLGEQSGHMYPGRIFDSPLNEASQKRIG